MCLSGRYRSAIPKVHYSEYLLFGLVLGLGLRVRVRVTVACSKFGIVDLWNSGPEASGQLLAYTFILFFKWFGLFQMVCAVFTSILLSK